MSFFRTGDSVIPPKPVIPKVLESNSFGKRFSFPDYKMTKDQWDDLPGADQDKMVEEIFEFYRTVWGFPYPRKTEDSFVWKFGILPELDDYVRNQVNGVNEKEEVKYRKQANQIRRFDSNRLLVGHVDNDDYVGFFGQVDQTLEKRDDARHLKQNLTGMGVANAFMPHLHHTPVKGMTSPYDGFWDDKLFRKAIRLALRWDSGAYPRSIRYGLRSIGGIQSVGNFKPTVAKFIYEHFTPDKGGVVFDYSCGWGGRLLGARSSKKDLTYIGVDPSVKTFECLQRLDAYLCDLYGYTPGEVTEVEISGSKYNQYRSDHVRITCCGSELFAPDNLIDRVDVAFSSPPYFDLEDYSAGDDGYENQSHVKYPGRDRWLHGFLQETADNLYKMVKPGGWAALNLADFRDIVICSDACAVFEKAGFTYLPDKNFQMRISVRTGNRKLDKLKGKKHKTENIFVFKK